MLERPKNLRNNLQIVDLENLVPKDHLLRKIDAVIANWPYSAVTTKFHAVPIVAPAGKGVHPSRTFAQLHQLPPKARQNYREMHFSAWVL